MIQVYPYNSPIILNDSIFTQYGGQTGSFTQAQRNAAYLIAEKQTTNFLGTFLLPTVVTGTYSYAQRLATDYGYVSQVFSVNILSQDRTVGRTCDIQRDSGCVFVWEDTFGYLEVGCLVNYCGCSWLIPYQIEVSYQAGLPTGVATQPDMLLGMVMAAQISLNEMIFPSQNESTGDIGVEGYSSLDYSEKRKSLVNTEFGNSAKANKIAQLIKGAVRPARRTMRLR